MSEVFFISASGRSLFISLANVLPIKNLRALVYLTVYRGRLDEEVKVSKIVWRQTDCTVGWETHHLSSCCTLIDGVRALITDDQALVVLNFLLSLHELVESSPLQERITV